MGKIMEDMASPSVKKFERQELSGTWKLHYSYYGQAAACLSVISLDFCAPTCCMQPKRGHFQFPNSRTVMGTLGLPVTRTPFLSSSPCRFLGTLEIGYSYKKTGFFFLFCDLEI